MHLYQIERKDPASFQDSKPRWGPFHGYAFFTMLDNNSLFEDVTPNQDDRFSEIVVMYGRPLNRGWMAVRASSAFNLH